MASGVIAQAYWSRFLPRFLGVLSMIGGFGWLTCLWPPLGAKAFAFVALFAIVAALLTCGWLLVRGVDDAVWYKQVETAAAPIRQ